jgi:hypothetical protein
VIRSRLRVTGLALVATCAFGATVVAPAFASLPELVNSEGKELVKKKITLGAGAVVLETVGTTTTTEILCTGVSSSGEVSGTKKIVKAKQTFTGCKLASLVCTPNKTGEFTTKELEGEFGYIKGTEKTVGLDLWPSSRTAAEREKHEFNAPFAEFICGGSVSRFKGSVIGQATPVNKKIKTGEKLSITYHQKTGKQEIEKLEGVEGGAKDVLGFSLAPGFFPFEEAGEEALGQMKFEEEAELKA